MNHYLQEIQAQQRLKDLHSQAQIYRAARQQKARWNWRHFLLRPSMTPALS